MPKVSYFSTVLAVTGIALAAAALAADGQALPKPVPPAAAAVTDTSAVPAIDAKPTDAKVPAAKAKGARAKEPKSADAAAKTADPGLLAPFAWLEGCWKGSVNQRDYLEYWLPLRGNLMIGASHTVRGNKTQDYEYLRIETRPEGIFYVDQPSGQKDKETAFRFVDRVVDTSNGRSDEVYTFAGAGEEFPQKIVYRRGSEGWLYPSVEGKLKGEDHKVIYPMRRVDCQSGEFIRK
jgi:Domain of unknown function (DUF6265)